MKILLQRFVLIISIGTSLTMQSMEIQEDADFEEPPIAVIEIEDIMDMSTSSAYVSDFSLLDPLIDAIDWKHCWWSTKNTAQHFFQTSKEMAITQLPMLKKQVVLLQQPVIKGIQDTATVTALSFAIQNKIPERKRVQNLLLRKVGTRIVQSYIPKEFPMGNTIAKYALLCTFEKNSKEAFIHEFLSAQTEEALHIIVNNIPHNCMVYAGRNLTALMRASPDLTMTILGIALQQEVQKRTSMPAKQFAQDQYKKALSALFQGKPTESAGKFLLYFTISFYCQKTSKGCKKVADELTKTCFKP